MDAMKRKSNVVVRVTPQSATHSEHSFDFVELCGSDLAASMETAAETRETERDRKCASETFNSLSRALISSS